MTRLPAVLAVVALLAVVHAAAAQTGAEAKTDVADLDLEGLLDLDVTTATRIDQPIEVAPATISVITEDRLRDHGWATLNEVLWSLPGTVRSQDYERRLVSMRGSFQPWNHNRLLMLVDGVPMNDPETGSAWTWEAMPLFVARRVEVLRGPGSATYGGNAVLGTVAVDTLVPADLGGHHVQARTSVGTRTASLDVVAAADDPADGGFVAGVHVTTTAGDKHLVADASGRVDDTGQLARFTYQDERRAVALLLKWIGHGRAEGLTAMALHQDYRSELGFGWWDWAADQPQHATDRQTTLQLRYVRDRGWAHLRTALQLQRRGYSYDLRILPAGAVDGTYPDGVDEAVRTSFDKLFASSQLIGDLPRGGSWLVGADYSGTLYRGDDLHTLSANPDDPALPPWDGSRPVGGLYSPVDGLPMHGFAGYGQLSTGGLLGRRVEVTAGGRVDVLRYRFRDPADSVLRSGSYQRFSPRLALVGHVADALTVKAMVATAFRLPTMVELFASHSLTSTGNPYDLEAETERTYEVAADWKVNDDLRLRTNAFEVVDDNLIDYTPSDGLLHNLFDSRRFGIESELSFATRRGPVEVDGWVSYAYTRLIEEQIETPELSTETRLTWVPAQVAKLGARLVDGPWRGTIEVYGQGRTFRRQTDLATPAFRAARPDSLAPWVDGDVTVARQLGDHLRLGLRVTGLLDTRAPVPATRDVGFDYRVEPREVFATVAVDE